MLLDLGARSIGLGRLIVDKDGEEITQVAVIYGPEANPNSTKHARLFAAAPDLLEALKDSRSMLQRVEVDPDEDTGPWDRAMDRIGVALSRANGGEG